MSEPNRKLKTAIAGRDVILMAGAHTPLAARIVEDLGIPVVFLGGNTLSQLYWAMPDYGLIQPSEVAECAARITAIVSIPVVVDGDQGGETVLNVRHSVQLMERAGASGMTLEDSLNPKKRGRGSIPLASMVTRIEAAVDARRNDDFTIIARAEGPDYGASAGELIDWGNTIAEAGADMFFPQHMLDKMTEADATQVVAEVKIPVIDVNGTADLVRRVGLRGHILTGWADSAMLKAGFDMYEYMSLHGEHPDLKGARVSVTDHDRWLDRDGWLRAMDRWMKAGKE
jgi:2-methylisocitrate lyase-like PEP mutase family enzyme